MLPLAAEPSPTQTNARATPALLPPDPHGDPAALTAAVHEAVAGIQQALLWGLDLDGCRGLALDSFVELTCSAWGALAHVVIEPGTDRPALHIDLDRSARPSAGSERDESIVIDELAAHALPHVHHSMTRQAPLAVQVPRSVRRAGVRPAPDRLLGRSRLRPRAARAWCVAATAVACRDHRHLRRHSLRRASAPLPALRAG